MMKPLVILAGLAFFVLAAVPLLAGPPQIEPAVLIYDGTVPLQVSTMSKPTVVDWNNDGKKDLVVGQFTQGNVWLYLNQGTDAEPVFIGGSKITSNGSPITTTYG